MRSRARTTPLLTALAAIVLLVALAGCGSGTSSSSEARTTPGTPSSESGNPLSGGPSSFIEPKNPNNKYAKFGEEASSADREAASAVLAENLEARESGDFATQCATLNAAGVKELAGSKKPGPGTCAVGLKKLAEPLKNTEEIRADTFDGQIDVLRVKGTKGYALYHGTDGNNWMMSMVKEGGTWKVGAIIAIEVG